MEEVLYGPGNWKTVFTNLVVIIMNIKFAKARNISNGPKTAWDNRIKHFTCFFVVS